ncbi:cysteine proteinase [Lichtheimia hyalospora FSU 10163]|nr:cysteine proteinase [Lichtheimia hyalospora FSU 10163]
MPSERVVLPTFGFGDLSREEINAVLSQAGVSLAPPKKTPFATGIRPKKRSSQKPPTIQEPSTTLASPTAPTPTASAPVTTVTTPTPNGDASMTAAESSPKTNGIATPSPAPTTASSPVNKEAAPKPKPSSWAALLRTPKEKEAAAKNKAVSNAAAAMTASKATHVVSKANTVTTSQQPPTVQPKFMGIADIINRYEPRYDVPLLEPRGMINNVNTCFMNVILQPLSHCPPFYNLLKTIGNHVVHSFKSKTPLLDSMIEFVNEFRPESTANPADHNPEPYGEPFVPEYVYDALRGQKRFDSLRGRQEDAEEFLCFLLDGLHEEMVSVLKEKKLQDEKAANGNGWVEVGPNNKTSNLQVAGFDESPISKLFGGKMRSTLRCPGAKDSVNLEPFQSLPLDIQPENVESIEDAIRNITVPEIMHDFMSPKKVRVEATKQVYLETLPPVLVLHMKRFVFDNVGGVQKLQKSVKYDSQLTIHPEWMTPVHRSGAPATYKLFGIVYHHGTSAGGGHYTCDIRRQNGQWLHINDTNIQPLSERDVLLTDKNTRAIDTIHTEQTPYILFYMKA